MTTEKEQLEAEIAKRDARIAELVGVRDHLRLQASIQAQEARTQKAIVAEIGAMVDEPCDWLTASAVREALKAQQPSACKICKDSRVVATTDTDHNGDHIERRCPACSPGVVDKRAAFEKAWASIAAELPSHQQNQYAADEMESAEKEAALVAWQARAALKAGQGEAVAPYGYLREVDGNVQLSIGALRPADRSGGVATPWAAIFAAPPASADARLVELLERIVEHLEYDAIGSPSEVIAGDLAKELRALLARSESKEVKP